MDMKLSLDLHGQFLMAKKEEMQHKIAFLEKDQRQDEANLFKARRNVYDIFYKMLLVSKRQGENAVQAYRGYLKKIPQNWLEARKQAVEFGDVHRQAVEDMKLSALLEIIKHLDDTMGEGGQAQ